MLVGIRSHRSEAALRWAYSLRNTSKHSEGLSLGLENVHICNKVFRNTPLHLHRIHEFPHMTVAKLDLGWSERCGNCTIWKTEDTDAIGVNVSRVFERLNEELRRDHTLFKLHPTHFDEHWLRCGKWAKDFWNRFTRGYFGSQWEGFGMTCTWNGIKSNTRVSFFRQC